MKAPRRLSTQRHPYLMAAIVFLVATFVSTATSSATAAPFFAATWG